MNRIKVIVSLLLVLSVLAPMTISARIIENDVVCVEYSDPTVDGVIDTSEGWSDPIYMNEATLAVVYNPNNALDMNATVYMAYNTDGLFIAGDIKEFDPNSGSGYDTLCYSDLDSAVLSGDYGFYGDTFTVCLDPMSKLSADSSRYNSKAPMYNIGFNTDGQSAIYRSNGAENGLLSDEASDVAVVIGENAWTFEAFISWDTVVADILANSNGKIDLLSEENAHDLLYGSVDSMATFLYKSDRFDNESEDVITYAIYATAAEVSKDGYPGPYTNGTDIKTFGVTYYLNHEHTPVKAYNPDDKLADFTQAGEKSVCCSVCGAELEKEKVAPIPFKDLKAGQWYENAIIRCYNFNFFNGTSATTFSPDMNMTRGMFVRMLANWNAVDTDEFECDNFTDVKADAWYYGAVAWAYEKGITSGTTETTFSPDAPITREQAATFFVNMMKYLNLYSNPAITELDDYEDVGEVSDWAMSSVLWAVENELIKSTSATSKMLQPKLTANRITVAQMLYNFDNIWIELIES